MIFRLLLFFMSVENNMLSTSTVHDTFKLSSRRFIYKPDKLKSYEQSDNITIEDNLFQKTRKMTKNKNNYETLQLGKDKLNNFGNKKQILFSQFKNLIDCDFFTENICLEVLHYPHETINHLLNKSSNLKMERIQEKYQLTRAKFKREMDSTRKKYTFSDKYFNNRNEDLRQNESIKHHGIFICPSEMEYARPKRGRSVSGEWKDIVNVEEYTQTLRMEKCLQPLSSCNYVSHHFKSECSQVYNYHRLLSWNKERGLHMDIFKVPTCCSCNMKGYSYLYPPLIRNLNKSKHQIQIGQKIRLKSKEPLDAIKNKETLNSYQATLLNASLRKDGYTNRLGLIKRIQSAFLLPSSLREKRDYQEKFIPIINYEYHPIINFFETKLSTNREK